MGKIKKTVIVIGWVLVGLVIAGAFWLQKLSGWSPSFSEVFGAFLGAFFAYLFIRFGEFLRLLYSRQVKAINSLVEIEHQLNRLVDEIGNVSFVIRGLLDKEMSFTNGGPIRIDFTSIKNLPFDPNPILGLSNLEFINQIFELSAEYSRINSDISNSNQMHREIREGLRFRTSTIEEYKDNYKIFCNNLRTIQSFINNVRAKTKEALVLARIMLQDQPLLVIFIRTITLTTIDKKIKDRIPEEMSKLDTEISEISERSKGEIENLMKLGETVRKSAQQFNEADS